jgi:hypothetical protein
MFKTIVESTTVARDRYHLKDRYNLMLSPKHHILLVFDNLRPNIDLHIYGVSSDRLDNRDRCVRRHVDRLTRHDSQALGGYIMDIQALEYSKTVNLM